MREFTKKEEKLITSTRITMDCFEMDDFENLDGIQNDLSAVWGCFIHTLDQLRRGYNDTKDKKYLKELIRLLPNSYKVVKL